MEKKAKTSFGTATFERRKHPRVSVDLPVAYWRINNPKSLRGRAGNISEGGLLLSIPEVIEVGQGLKVKVFIGTDLELKSIEAIVQVVWKGFDLGKQDEYHRIGVRFIRIRPEDMENLKKFLNSLVDEKASVEWKIQGYIVEEKKVGEDQERIHKIVRIPVPTPKK